MKTFLFLSTVVVGVFALTVPEDVKNYWISQTVRYKSFCECQSGVDPALSDAVFKKLQYPNDPCLKCYLKCLYGTPGLLKSDGTIDRNIAIKIRECTPGVPYRENDCNNCFCTETGILGCTQIGCLSQKHRDMTNCEVGTKWKDGCNDCECAKGFGTICTNKPC
ncbi:hypothetical protein FQR65_LT06798 [Abscondita terminalis]|nr:hypothetical protein FQR65_LT06798 [Abscondita terminalis]